MSAIIEAIVKEVEAFNQSIRDTLASKRINNTGEASKSLEVIHGKDFVQSVGVFYLEFLDTGRGSNPKKSSKGKFLEAIKKWLRTKHGITKEPELTKKAEHVVYRINALGTLIFRDNKKGIELTKKISILRENINEEVADAVKIEIEQKLDKFKKIYKFNLG